MKIKKFEARTEQEAIEMVRDELGMDALVLNIKKIQPKGLFAFLRKTVVEVTAAYEERSSKPDVNQAIKEIEKPAAAYSDLSKQQNESVKNQPYASFSEEIKTHSQPLKEISLSEHQVKIKDLESQLESNEQLLSRLSRQLLTSIQKAKDGQRKYNSPIVQLFYETLASSGVTDEIAAYILDDIDLLQDIDEIDINLIVKIVYNTIVTMLGEPAPATPCRVDKKLSKPSVYAFIGSTGVGKTTTIAKLAANFLLQKQLNVGMITSDTYRIAAIEQLKHYADILGIEVCVVYEAPEMKEYVDIMSGINDVILIDTAGRSHKSEKGIDDLKALLEVIEYCEVFLVLSLTTKYEDMLSIIDIYQKLTDFRIIFTKWDETINIGSILNICHTTGKRLAYITTGQNVPEDFHPMRPDWIARALLGLGEE